MKTEPLGIFMDLTYTMERLGFGVCIIYDMRIPVELITDYVGKYGRR